MPKFSQSSIDKLQTVHPDLQTLFNEVIKTFDCTIIVGHRGQADQDKALAEGKTQLKWPLSNHNKTPSYAVDVMPCVDGKIDWNAPTNTAFFAGYVMAIAQQLKDSGKITHVIRYGGNWKMDHDLKANHFADGDHFEIFTG